MIEATDNLTSLHKREEQLRAESLAAIEADVVLSEHWNLVAEAMNAIYAFTHDHPHESENELTLQYLGTLGLDLRVLSASTEHDFDSVFADQIHLRASGLVIGEDAFFNSHVKQLAALTVHHSVPAVYKSRQFVAAGGLLSYGGSGTDAYHLAGVYTGRILKGDKPANLPVQQATKVELFINLKTAKALGITVPLPLSGRADEVVE